MKAESGGKLLIFGVSREVYLHEKMKWRCKFVCIFIQILVEQSHSSKFL